MEKLVSYVFIHTLIWQEIKSVKLLQYVVPGLSLRVSIFLHTMYIEHTKEPIFLFCLLGVLCIENMWEYIVRTGNIIYNMNACDTVSKVKVNV